jgi:hypothetical protein
MPCPVVADACGAPSQSAQPEHLRAPDTTECVQATSAAAEGTPHVSTVSLAIAAPLKHSRLTTFFRYLLAIPLMIVNYFYAIVAYVAVVIAWFAIVITGRYPLGLYNFAAGYLRFSTRVVAYMTLAVDVYPPFSGEEAPGYPAQVVFPEHKQRYSRLKTLFRVIYIIPAYLMVIVTGILLYLAVIVSWFAILITARDPFSAYKSYALNWVLKFAALYLLVIEDY